MNSSKPRFTNDGLPVNLRGRAPLGAPEKFGLMGVVKR